MVYGFMLIQSLTETWKLGFHVNSSHTPQTKFTIIIHFLGKLMDDELICFEGLFRASYVGPCQCYEVENMDRTAHEKPHSPL